MDRRQIPRNSLTQSPESPKRKYGNIMELFLSGSCQKQKNQDKKQEENENILNSAKSQNTSDTNSSGGQTNNNTNIKLTQKDMQAIRKSVIIDHEESIKPKYKDFKIMTLLGEGSFGSVYLATHIKSKKKFALKVLQKKKMIIQKQVRFAASQINILKQIDHPFTMNLKFTFQTANYIYLGLDYCQGKDLAYHLVKQCNFNQNQSKFYVAQILLALQHLHSKNILYRDMKPDNILLDCDGHIKITDFGLSKQCNDNRQVAKSFCGSPAYLSPEMVSKKGASKATDFYGLGAVLYQLLVGQPPFYDQNIKILYQNITQGKLKFPKILSPNAKSLLSGLLQKNPQKRLGWNGIDQIKNHPFFASINWEKLLKKQIKPPIRPSIQQIKLKNKQQCQQLQFISNILHNDHDYQQNKTRTNRFLNFSFFRQDCFQKQE